MAVPGRRELRPLLLIARRTPPRSTCTAAPTPRVLVAALRGRRASCTRVFTRRRDDLRRHAGEISFPGGRQDADEEDLRDHRPARGRGGDRPAARRGRRSSGALTPTPTLVTNYAIYPFVGRDRARASAGRRARPRSTRCSSCRCRALRDGHSRQRLRAPRRAVPHRRLRGRRPLHLGRDRADPGRPARPARAAAGARGRSALRCPFRSGRRPCSPTRSTSRRSS